MAAEEMYVLEPMLVPCQTVSFLVSLSSGSTVSSSSTFARPDTSFSHDGDGDGAGSGVDADSEQGQRACRDARPESAQCVSPPLHLRSYDPCSTECKTTRTLPQRCP